MAEIDFSPVWKVRVKVFVNGVLANTYFKPDTPQPKLEATERMVNMGRAFNVDDGLDLKDWSDSPRGLTYQGTLTGDTVRREMTVVQV